MNIEIKKFEELTTFELYEILKLRAEVFVVEQNCIYNDIDNKDIKAFHILIKEDSEIIAYLRVLEIDNNDKEISFGRVLVSQKGRGKGYAKLIVKEAINFINKTWKEKAIAIEAQSYLQKFYESFGFNVTSDEFLEDGIPHIWMEKQV